MAFDSVNLELLLFSHLVPKVYREDIKDMVIDTVSFLHKSLQDKFKHILVEGANATMLDIDFGG